MGLLDLSRLEKKSISSTGNLTRPPYKDLIDENGAEKNLQRELWSENSCARQVFRRSNIEIPSLKDVNWLRFCREQLKPMDQAWEQS